MIIVDASVAVQWVVEEDTSAQSELLLVRPDLVAPDFMLIEVANALYRKVFVGDISTEHATAGLRFIKDKVELRPVSIELLSRAIERANEMNHPVYDCLYLALAEAISATIATYDQELRSRATYHGHAHLLFDMPQEE